MLPLSDSVKSSRFPFITIALIAGTSYVFYLQVTSFDSEAFLLQYALIPGKIDFGYFPSLVPFVTSMFLHGNLLHIVSNMWFLWIFGDNVEGYFGKIRYLLLYFVSGILGSIAQFVLSPTSNIPMLGASGAIAGVLGAYYVLFPHHKVKTLIPLFGFFTVTEVSAMVMLGYWFLLQLLSGVISLPGVGELGGIAFFAHIGGFLTGLLFARLFKSKGSSDFYRIA